MLQFELQKLITLGRMLVAFMHMHVMRNMKTVYMKNAKANARETNFIWCSSWSEGAASWSTTMSIIFIWNMQRFILFDVGNGKQCGNVPQLQYTSLNKDAVQFKASCRKGMNERKNQIHKSENKNKAEN